MDYRYYRVAFPSTETGNTKDTNIFMKTGECFIVDKSKVKTLLNDRNDVQVK